MKKGKAKGKQLESGDYLIFDKLVLCAPTKKDIPLVEQYKC